LPSYLIQKHVDEIIIVDDCSTDNTKEVIQKFPSERIRCIRHAERKGAACARLTGINAAKNSLVAYGEDDLIFEETYVDALLKDMRQTNADIIAGRIIYMMDGETPADGLERCNTMKKPLIDYNTFEGNFGVRTEGPVEVPFVHACFLAKKEIYLDFEYDTNFRGNGFREETDPQVMALEHGRKIMFTPSTTCYHLPRSMAFGGGQRSMGKIAYSFWRTRNDLYFLKKHHLFLSKKYPIRPLPLMAVN
jgi:glycosyltransferase involved in cell wall biosynthesis